MVAGEGFEGRPSGYRFAPVAVVCRLPAQAQPACHARTLGDTACKNAPPEPFCFADPTSSARRAHNPSKKQTVVIKTTVDWLREKDLNQRPSGYEVMKSFVCYHKNSKRT